MQVHHLLTLQSAIGPDFKIKLDNLHLSNTIFSSDMSGELHFDAASGRMAGAFKAKLKGLAALIQAIDAKSAALPPAQAMTAGQATMSLKMADAMGQPDATDPTTKIYNIVLDSNGISLNGKLMMPMPTAPPAFFAKPNNKHRLARFHQPLHLRQRSCLRRLSFQALKARRLQYLLSNAKILEQ